MRQKKAPAGTGAAAAALGANLAAQQTTLSSVPQPTLPCQAATGDNLADLATQALARADRAAVLVNCCAAAGDWRGFELWRRRLLAHQAVAWAALHPEPLEVLSDD